MLKWIKGHKVWAFIVLLPILAGLVDYIIGLWSYHGLWGFPLSRMAGSIVTVVLLFKLQRWLWKGIKWGFSKLVTSEPRKEVENE